MRVDNYTQLLIHAVWATYERQGLIGEDIQSGLHAAIINKCRSLKSTVLAVGGVEDHTHLWASLWPSVSVAQLIGEVKGASAHFVNHELRPPIPLRWQGSYGAFSISKHDLHRVADYVQRQREHHAANTTWADFERCWIEPSPKAERLDERDHNADFGR